MMTNSEIRSFLDVCPLIAVDMDGTCLDAAGRVAPATRMALEMLVERGVAVVPTTGRGAWDVTTNLLPGFPAPYIISANGALVTEGLSGRRLRERLIPRDVAVAAIEEFWGHDIALYVHEDDPWSTHIFGCAYADEAERIADGCIPTTGFTDCLPAAVSAGTPVVHKIGLVFHEPWTFERIESVVAERLPDLVSYRVDIHSVELTARGASKAEALADLCRQIGIDVSRVCAIGDNGNDEAMLCEVGLGVAMANAPAFVRAAADCVTAFDNNHEGVVRFLEGCE